VLRVALILLLAQTSSALFAADTPPAPAPSAGPISPRYSGAPFIRTWDSDDYRASPVNWHIVQHPQTGFIYVGNNFGVLEYDGAAWRTYPMPDEGPVRSLAIDASGRVWLGGVGTVAVLRTDARGLPHAISVMDRVPPSNRPFGDFIFSLGAPDGVYFSTVNEVVRFGADERVRRWPLPQRALGLWWQDGALHVSAGLNGILRLQGDAIVPIADSPPGPNGRLSLRVFTSRPAGADGTLLLTSRGPLHWRGPGSEPTPLSAASAAAFANETATAATFLPDGRLAFGFLRNGLRLLDAQGRAVAHIDQTRGLPSNRIEEIAADRDGGLWIAQRTGLARLELDSPFAQHGVALGLSGSPRAFQRFGDRLYVTHNEGVAWRDEATGRFRPVEGVTAGLNTLFEADGRLFGTGGSLYEITRDDRARTVLAQSLTSIHPLRSTPGTYIGGSPSGVWLLRFAAGRWERLGALTGIAEGLTRFRDDGDGFVWAVPYGGRGVWRLDFRNGASLDCPVRLYGEPEGVPGVRRRDSARLVDLGGELYLTCGVWTRRYDRAADRFEPASDIVGLPPDSGAIVAHNDRQGAHWWFLNRPEQQLLRLTASGDRRWRAEPIPSGPLRGLIPNSAYVDPLTTTLWVAGQGSLISAALDWQPTQARPPLRAFIREVATLAGEPLWRSPTALPLAPLVLPPRQDALRLAFAAPGLESDFRGKHTLTYRTWLEGLEPAWSEWSEGSTREFTNLPYRAFTFHVQARALDGRISEPVALAFAINPPWWLTRWAFAAYGVLVLALLAALVAVRTRLLRRRAAQLETVVAARTAELARLRQIDRDESAAARLAAERARLEVLRYQLNPHFLFNALASVRSQLPPALDRARATIEQLTEFCRLTLFRPESGAHLTLDEEMHLLRAYLDIEQTRWGPLLTVEIDVAPAAASLPLPPLLLLPLVENALKYGRSSQTGALTVRITARLDAAGALSIEVGNTGAWIESTDSPSVPSLGIGLENLRQRLARYYPGRHEFTTVATDGWVVARLNLSLSA